VEHAEDSSSWTLLLLLFEPDVANFVVMEVAAVMVRVGYAIVVRLDGSRAGSLSLF